MENVRALIEIYAGKFNLRNDFFIDKYYNFYVYALLNWLYTDIYTITIKTLFIF